MTELPDGNEIVDGEWFESKKNGISISSEISERYELQVNDQIVIDIAGKKIKSFIQSIREVNWENFSPNFSLLAFRRILKKLHQHLLLLFTSLKKKIHYHQK
jgi:putative ABC transport system permease protein